MEAGTSAKPPQNGSTAALRARALIPLALLALVLAGFAAVNTSVLDLVGVGAPPADEVDVRRVEFKAGSQPEIQVRVTNPQTDALEIAMVSVNDAFVRFTLDGPAELGRLDSRSVTIPYHWDEGDPYVIGITTSSGVQTVHDVPAAVPSEGVTADAVLGFGLIGVLVGLIPVALGMLWLPSLRTLSERALAGFMALTAGLLAFLAVDALTEAWEVQAELPSALGGAGLILLGVTISFFGIDWLATRLKENAQQSDAISREGLALATAIAVGIGLHNFGEGLAIGSSFALGSLTFGTLLIVGFTVHNITEGLGIVAPVAAGGVRVPVSRLALLAVVAGLPAVFGAWVGGFIVSQWLAVFFFAIAAGAAAQVVYEVYSFISRREPQGWRSPYVALGFVAGVAIMYLTSLLIG